MFKFILFLPLFFSLTAFAKMDPSIQWKKIETPHFEVIFNEKHTELAKRYAEYAEIAYEYLIPIFKEAPAKTALIINDNTDQANGYASFFPYPHMMIFPTLPLTDSTISHFDNWGLGLIIHEYAHILNFYPANGLYVPFKYIFGSIVRPLALLPRWYMEGLAVALETKFTKHGRLRSGDTQAAIRAFIRDKRLKSMTIDKINEGNNTWPYGGAPYLFGSLVWQKTIDEEGIDIIYRMLHKKSKRFPWTLNSTFKSFYKTKYQGFLREIYQESIENYKEKKNFGRKVAMKKGNRILDFAISPDLKKMISLQGSREEGTRLMLHERTSKKEFNFSKGKVLTKTSQTLRMGWFSDSNRIYYDKVDRENKRYNTHFKLYTYDIAKKKQTLIKTSSRDYLPHISDDNQKITFIKNGGARNSLYVANIDGQNEGQIYQAGLEVRLSYPTFINDTEIIFLERSREGQQILKKITISTKEVKIVDSNLNDIIKIKRQKNNYLLVAQDNGTKNIYSGKYPFYKLQALTDSDTAANSAIWDPVVDQLYISQLTSHGNRIYSLKKSQLVKSSSLSPAKKVVDYKWPSQFVEKPDIDTNYEIKDYSAWKYMLPRYWVPYAYNVNDGFVFEGSTSSFDPLAKHGLSLGLGYDTITEQISYSGAYLNSSTSLDIIASYGLLHEPLSGTDDYFKHTRGSLGAGFFLPGLSNSWRGALGANYISTEQNEFPEDKTELVGPSISFNYGKFSDHGSNLKTGVVNFGLSHRHFIDHKDYLGIDLTMMNFVYNFNHFLPNEHYLIFRLNGAIADNIEDNGSQNSNNLITYGVKTIGGNFIGNLINSNILMRGYSSGAFTAKQLAVAGLAYDFPIVKIYRGPGTGPLFFKSIHLNIFTDAASLKGRYLFTPDPDNSNLDEDNFTYVKTDWDKVFVGSGFEVRFRTTISYHVPVDFVVGGYYGFDRNATGGFAPFITFALGGYGPLGKTNDKKYFGLLD